VQRRPPAEVARVERGARGEQARDGRVGPGGCSEVQRRLAVARAGVDVRARRDQRIDLVHGGAALHGVRMAPWAWQDGRRGERFSRQGHDLLHARVDESRSANAGTGWPDRFSEVADCRNVQRLVRVVGRVCTPARERKVGRC